MKKLLIPFVSLMAIAMVASSCSGGEDTSATNTTTTGAAPATTGTTGATAANFAGVAQLATANCMPCHSAEKHAGGLNLTTYADVMKGGEHGAPVVAGDPDNSLIIKVLKGPVKEPEVPQMPMKRAPLAAEDIQKISDWIKAGAKEA